MVIPKFLLTESVMLDKILYDLTAVTHHIYSYNMSVIKCATLLVVIS
jgi:hypothetical protein